MFPPLLLFFFITSFPLLTLPSQVPNVEDPAFFRRMDKLVEYNNQILSIGRMDLPGPVKTIMTLPYIERMVAGVFQAFIATPLKTGSVDIQAPAEGQVVY